MLYHFTIENESVQKYFAYKLEIIANHLLLYIPACRFIYFTALLVAQVVAGIGHRAIQFLQPGPEIDSRIYIKAAGGNLIALMPTTSKSPCQNKTPSL